MPSDIYRFIYIDFLLYYIYIISFDVFGVRGQEPCCGGLQRFNIWVRRIGHADGERGFKLENSLEQVSSVKTGRGRKGVGTLVSEKHRSRLVHVCRYVSHGVGNLELKKEGWENFLIELVDLRVVCESVEVVYLTGSVITLADEGSFSRLVDEFALAQMNEDGMWLLEFWMKSEVAGGNTLFIQGHIYKNTWLPREKGKKCLHWTDGLYTCVNPT